MEMNDKPTDLKLQLGFVKKKKFIMENKLNGMRSKIGKLAQEAVNLNTENEYLLTQITDMSCDISQLKCQMLMIDVCKESENSNREVKLTNMEKHKNGYDDQFNKEREVTAIQKEKLKQKEEELLKQNEHRTITMADIEKECDSIETECSILINRNKAILRQLRRKYHETDKKRQELMKRNNV